MVFIMLRKAISEGFADVDAKQGIVVGVFSHFGSKDSDGDIVQKGAFNKSVKERGPEGADLIALLMDHDKKKAAGRVNRIWEDNERAYYEGKAGRHTNGRDFLYMAEDGIIKNHSFGYRIIKENKGRDANYLTEIALLEISPLQFLGANSNTPMLGVKSLTDIVDDLDLLEKALKRGNYTDETYLIIESKVKSLYSSLKPDASTLADDEVINHIHKSFKLN